MPADFLPTTAEYVRILPELALIQQWHGKRSIELLGELGFLGPRVGIPHVYYIGGRNGVPSGPVDELALLSIGSRPASRPEAPARDELSALRAIPWVFAWTQNRCLLPAWYGCGTAFATGIADGAGGELRRLYCDWPFFRTFVENLEMTLAKSSIEMQPWLQRFMRKLLDGDARAASLLAHDPFAGAKPSWLKADLYRYEMTGFGDTAWWRRTPVRPYVPAVRRPER